MENLFAREFGDDDARTAGAHTAAEQDRVWVNTATGIYHKQVDQYYGHTKEGKYMTEAEAKAHGYKETSAVEAKDKK